MKNSFFLVLLLALSFSCKPTEISRQGFAILKSLTEQKLRELLKAEAWSFDKDSVNVIVTVPRSHCRKVLGKTLNKWVTSKGGNTLEKADLLLSLHWEVLQDTSQVRLHFLKIRHGLTKDSR
jgi:hypothetical protein